MKFFSSLIRDLQRLRHAQREAQEALKMEPGFDENSYLAANPDVAAAVARGDLKSGRQHFDIFGKNEGRRLAPTPTPSKPPEMDIETAKSTKLERLQPLLRNDLPVIRTAQFFDFLTEELRHTFNIVDTNAVSKNEYDGHVLSLIDRNREGWVLDCGAGRRSVYYPNVVNFEIAAYDSTDVRGVGEVLPFIDNAFDAVVSLAVLEHVKDPFRCAEEIARVLKPGGELICCVPFLQPYHGFPHHYYNMTHQGLRNLFESSIDVDRIEVYGGLRPISTLTWLIGSWANGLHGETRNSFLNMRISDFLQQPQSFFGAPFVEELTQSKNLELACANVLFGHKRSCGEDASGQCRASTRSDGKWDSARFSKKL